MNELHRELAGQTEALGCPHCGNTARLESIPMQSGAIYMQCPCGGGWEIVARRQWIN